MGLPRHSRTHKARTEVPPFSEVRPDDAEPARSSTVEAQITTSAMRHNPALGIMPTFVNPAAVKSGGFMETAEIGHVHRVGRGPVIGVRAAEDGVDPEIADERLGMGEAFSLGQEGDRLGPVTVDLGDVEDGEGAGENAPGRTVLIPGRCRLFPQHDGRTAFAFADLGFQHLPLPIGAPGPLS
jgi:hypothetical protein